jgi:hypothetical protein
VAVGDPAALPKTNRMKANRCPPHDRKQLSARDRQLLPPLGEPVLYLVPLVIDANLFLLVIKGCKERLSRIGELFLIGGSLAHIIGFPSRAVFDARRIVLALISRGGAARGH